MYSNSKQRVFNEKPTNCTKESQVIDVIPKKGGYYVFLEKSNMLVYWNEKEEINVRHKISKNNEKLHLTALTTEQNKHLVIYNNGNSLKVWNPKTKETKTLANIPSNKISCLIPLDGTESIAVATTNNALQILDVTSAMEIMKIITGGIINCLYYDHGLEQLITADATGTMTVWDINRKTKIQEISREYISCFAPDMLDLKKEGKHSVALSNNGSIQLWKYDNRKWIKSKYRIMSGAGGIKSICVVDNTFVVTGYEGGIIKVWHIMDKEKCLQKLILRDLRLNIDRVVSKPGFCQFYSVGSGSKNKMICGCIPSGQVKPHYLCHFWQRPGVQELLEKK